MNDVGVQIQKMVDQARQQAVERLDALPYVKGLRSFWTDLNSMREWWPVLIPLLTFIGWRTYRAERKQVEHEKRKAAEQAIPTPAPQAAPPSPTNHTPSVSPMPELPAGYRASVIIHRTPE